MQDKFDLINIGSIFERFFILGGPRGTRQKKLQNLDPVIDTTTERFISVYIYSKIAYVTYYDS